jgi:hypothetical protein
MGLRMRCTTQVCTIVCGKTAKDGLFDELKKALAERVLNAELDEHLGRDSGWQGEPPQWLFEEDGSDRDLEDRRSHPARPGRHVRSEADCPLSAPISWLRRKDRVRARQRLARGTTGNTQQLKVSSSHRLPQDPIVAVVDGLKGFPDAINPAR